MRRSVSGASLGPGSPQSVLSAIGIGPTRLEVNPDAQDHFHVCSQLRLEARRAGSDRGRRLVH
jgi:hypothetical protein